MKKKVDNNVLSESCYMMNISKTLTTIDGNSISHKISEDNKIALQNSLTPPQSVINSPNSKVKVERENSPNETEFGDDNNDGKSSPPLSSLGPGAEIKGKICHPIPSSSKLEESEPLDESCKAANLGTTGGRLTFFREGKLLLELSHRTEQGSWVQVKSKTYWPPPSTTTSSSIQHPLRHDTPTTHSDDCSSVNSSPWSSDHIRKQSGPNPKIKLWLSTDHLFFFKNTPFIKSLRRKVRLRRNPYLTIIGPISSFIGPENNTCSMQERLTSRNSNAREVKYSDRKKRLEKKICLLAMHVDLKLDENLSIGTLFEVRENSNETIDPTFITPRKRYLKALEADHDANSRKKVHSLMSPASLHLKHCDRLPSPSLHGPHKSAISSQNSSSYSIDSLLSNESDKKSESFLRNLLRSDKPRHSSQIKHNVCKDRNINQCDVSNHMKMERGTSPYPKERKEYVNDHKKALPERFDLSQDLRFSPHSNLGSLYLNPYLDPRYMMLHSLSTAPPFLPVSQPSDMASAVAVAAAAAAGYPLSPLHISTLTANSLMPSGIVGSAYAPTSSLASQLIRSPTPNRASPLSVPHSPSPKLSPAIPSIPLSPHFGNPRDSWTPSNLQNSPHKYPSTSSVSPPPQEVPLNLTKPKRK